MITRPPAACGLRLRRKAGLFTGLMCLGLAGLASAATACPDDGWFESRVAELMASPPPTSLSVQIEHLAEGLRVQVSTPTGQRQLSSPTGDCAALMEAAAVATAVALEPIALPEPSAPSESASLTARAEPTPEPTAFSTRLTGQVGTHLTSGIAPATAPGLHLSVALDLGARWRLALGGRLDRAADATAAEGRAEGQFTGGDLKLCHRWTHLHLCGLGLAGKLEARGVGFEVDRQVGVPVLAVGPRVEGRLPLGAPGPALTLVGWAEGLAPLSRSTLRVDGEVVQESGSVFAAAGLSVEISAPR